MICKYCKTENPNGAVMCSNCGASMNQGPVEILNMKRYLKEEAAPATKSAAKLVSIFLIASILLMVITAGITMFAPIYDAPFMSLVASIAGEDTDELEDMFDEAEDKADEYEEWLEAVEDDLDKDEEKIAKAFVDKSIAVAKTPSLMNISSYVDYLEKNEDDIEDIFGGASLAGIDDLGEPFDIILTILLVLLAVVALFTVLGGLKIKSGPVVAGIIFGLIYNAIFGGVILLALTFVAQLLLTTHCGKVTKAYKKYVADNTL